MPEINKPLWVTLASLGMIVFVTGIGSLYFYPKPEIDAKPVLASKPVTLPDVMADTDPVEYVRESKPGEFPGIEASVTIPEEKFIVSLKDEEAENTVRVKPAAVIKKVHNVVVSSPKKTQPVTNTVKKQTIAMKTTTTSPPVVKPVFQKKVLKESYWIQVASFGSLNKAEAIQVKLEENGIHSVLSPKEVEGNVFYRVRIGAYEHQKEAEKFCTDIKKMNLGLTDSYVTKVIGK